MSRPRPATIREARQGTLDREVSGMGMSLRTALYRFLTDEIAHEKTFTGTRTHSGRFSNSAVKNSRSYKERHHPSLDHKSSSGHRASSSRYSEGRSLAHPIHHSHPLGVVKSLEGEFSYSFLKCFPYVFCAVDIHALDLCSNHDDKKYVNSSATGLVQTLSATAYNRLEGEFPWVPVAVSPSSATYLHLYGLYGTSPQFLVFSF